MLPRGDPHHDGGVPSEGSFLEAAEQADLFEIGLTQRPHQFKTRKIALQEFGAAPGEPPLIVDLVEIVDTLDRLL